MTAPLPPSAPSEIDAFAALRVPTVRSWILGRIAWALGTQTLSTAVGWQIYEQTGSELALGLVGLVQVVPVIVLALWSGSIVDRYNRRDIAMLAVIVHALCGVAMLLIALGVQAVVCRRLRRRCETAERALVDALTCANLWRASAERLAQPLPERLAPPKVN